MSYILGYNLSQLAEQIIRTLLIYRGTSAKQLISLMNAPFQYTLSQEKSVYNYLRKLKKQGLVAAHKLQANVANGSVYYLTPKGYDYARDMMNIDEGAVGEGWIQRFGEFEEQSLGDLNYDLYSPSIKQPAHHLLLIDFFIQLNMVDEDNYSMIPHRLNLYAAETYEMDGKSYRYRPDAEILIGTKKFAIEIDRATESHEQLLLKMETYKRYLDYCNAAGRDSLDRIDGIIFVVETRRRDHGIKRRWKNVLSAFFKRLSKYQDRLNLIMTTIDATQETLRFELNRSSYEQEAQKKIETILKDDGYSIVSTWSNTRTTETAFAHGLTETRKYKVFFNATSQEFESRLYIRYLYFLKVSLPFAQSPESVEKIKEFEYIGNENFIFYARRKPFIVEGLSLYGMDPELVKKLNGLQNDLHLHDLDPVTSFSIFD